MKEEPLTTVLYNARDVHFAAHEPKTAARTVTTRQQQTHRNTNTYPKEIPQHFFFAEAPECDTFTTREGLVCCV